MPARVKAKPGRATSDETRPDLTFRPSRDGGKSVPSGVIGKMVGLVRFELTTSCTPCKRATRLRYGPMIDRKGEEDPWHSRRQALSCIRILGRDATRNSQEIRRATAGSGILLHPYRFDGYRLDPGI